MRRRLLTAFLTTAVAAVPAADAFAAKRKPHAPVRLKAFASCTGLKTYAATHAIRDLGIGRPMPMPDAGAPTTTGDAKTDAPQPLPAAAPQAEGGAGAGTDFSQTNVQEQGVDEPDVVKTNGKHLFAL